MIWFGKSFIEFCKSFIHLIKLVSTCVVCLLAAGTRIMVQANHFDDDSVVPTVYVQAWAYPAHMRDTNHSRDITGRPLSIILEDLLDNPMNKYSWADKVGILLFRTINCEDSKNTRMRTALE